MDRLASRADSFWATDPTMRISGLLLAGMGSLAPGRLSGLVPGGGGGGAGTAALHRLSGLVPGAGAARALLPGRLSGLVPGGHAGMLGGGGGWASRVSLVLPDAPSAQAGPLPALGAAGGRAASLRLSNAMSLWRGSMPGSLGLIPDDMLMVRSAGGSCVSLQLGRTVHSASTSAGERRHARGMGGQRDGAWGSCPRRTVPFP
jgi:hypothetical protein